MDQNRKRLRYTLPQQIKKLSFFVLLATTFATSLLLVGCNNSETPVATSESPKNPHPHPHQSGDGKSVTTKANAGADSPENGSDHEHADGGHGGMIVEIGSDSYHAEFVVETNGTVRMFTLGKDETRIQEIESQTIKAFVKALETQDAKPMDLTATPQEGDTEGNTSQFVGQLPPDLIGQAIEVTIPNLRIKNERFRLGFKTQHFSQASDMPPAVTDAEGEKLYLTAGGKYTEADIVANGSITAGKKFAGAMSAHNMNPMPGDRICPVTQTKANPKFVWVIDGKNYEFCCPPCIDEFVRMAKEEPDQIKDPSEYVK